LYRKPKHNSPFGSWENPENREINDIFYVKVMEITSGYSIHNHFVFEPQMNCLGTFT